MPISRSYGVTQERVEGRYSAKFQIISYQIVRRDISPSDGVGRIRFRNRVVHGKIPVASGRFNSLAQCNPCRFA